MRALRCGALVCAVMVLLTGCGRTESALVPPAVSPIVRIGYTSAAPDYVLAKLFVAAFLNKGVPARLDRIETPRSDSGVRIVGPDVTQPSSLWHRARLNATATGEVDVVPSYTTQLLYAMNPSSDLFQEGLRLRTANADAEFDSIFTEVSRSLPSSVRALRPSSAQRTMAIAVRNKDPRTQGIHTYSQLAQKCSRFHLLIHAYPDDVMEMEHWEQLMGDAYRCFPASIRTGTHVANQDDVVLTFAPDPLFLDGQWRLLDDDRALIPPSYVFAVVSKSAIDRSRQLVLEGLTDKITTQDIAELLRVEYRTPDELDAFISNWLRQQGITGKLLVEE